MQAAWVHAGTLATSLGQGQQQKPGLARCGCGLQVMGSADAAARVQAFLLVREMGTALPPPTLSSAMKVHARPMLLCSIGSAMVQ